MENLIKHLKIKIMEKEKKDEEIIRVSYMDKGTPFSKLNDINQQFNFEKNKYENKISCFYLLENNEKIKRDLPQRTYDIGDFIIFKRSNYKVDIFKIVNFLPDNYLIVQIEPFINKNQ